MTQKNSPARRTVDPRLLQGSIPRALFLLAVPIMGANILQVAYQIVDAFWVGRLGAFAVAAVSITLPVMFVLVAAGMGFAIAGTTLIAQYTGARDHKMVDHVAAQTLVTIVAIALGLAALGWVLAPWLLRLMGVAPEVYGAALGFMRVIFAALPFTFIYAMAQGLLRGAGEVKAPLYIVAGTVIVNFALDPVLIFGRLGVPALGVMGAAIATLVAQMIAAAVALRLLFGGRYGIHVRWGDFVPDIGFVKRAFLLGYPASIEQSARGLGMTVLTFLIVSFGTVVTASFGVGANVFNVMLIPAMGFSMATSTLVGQSIGAGDLARAEKVARLAGIVTFSVLTVFGLVCVAFAPQIVRFFVPEAPRVIKEGAAYIRIVAWSFGFIGLQFALMGVLRAAGEMIAAMTISLVSQWALQIPLAFALAKYSALGADGIWWSTPLANVATAIVAALWFRRGTWKTRRLIHRPTPVEREQEQVEEQAQM
ncbi:MAG: MATE family efflux transporter [Alphaproteobacteria bacterium]|nr:MATE family efflux transporter [Alphaproteobacteria bacterium]MBV9692483.1 MATE family efflux transporter [Alphaproteobacteria bacterium]